MKKLLAIIFLCGVVLASCNSTTQTTEEIYADWIKYNDTWLQEQMERLNPDGTPYYTKVVPNWDPASFVLMHYFNDPAENADKLSPYLTSTVDVRYELHLADSTAVDSSTALTTYGPGIARFTLRSLVPGWVAAVPQMHCGDTAEVIVPYNMGYGSAEAGKIKPYSNLRFNIRLVDIADLNKRP